MVSAIFIIAYFLKAFMKKVDNWIAKQQILELSVTRIMEKQIDMEKAHNAAMDASNRLWGMKANQIESTVTEIKLSLVEQNKILTHIDKNQKVIGAALDRMMKLEDRVHNLEMK